MIKYEHVVLDLKMWTNVKFVLAKKTVQQKMSAGRSFYECFLLVRCSLLLNYFYFFMSINHEIRHQCISDVK